MIPMMPSFKDNMCAKSFQKGAVFPFLLVPCLDARGADSAAGGTQTGKILILLGASSSGYLRVYQWNKELHKISPTILTWHDLAHFGTWSVSESSTCCSLEVLRRGKMTVSLELKMNI